MPMTVDGGFIIKKLTPINNLENLNLTTDDNFNMAL